MRILVIQGPNLNLLGTRQPNQYGHRTLVDVQQDLDRAAAPLGVVLDHRQSNHEGVLIDAIHGAAETCAGVLINPAGLGHTSVCLRDALLGVGLPFVEVHISNVYAREPFRQHSLLADVAAGVVVGFGTAGYSLGLQGLVECILRADAQGAHRGPQSP